MAPAQQQANSKIQLKNLRLIYWVGAVGRVLQTFTGMLKTYR